MNDSLVLFGVVFFGSAAMSVLFYTLGPDNSFIQGVLHQFHFTPSVQIICLYRMFFINFTLQLRSRLFVYTGCST
jgi:hypothetical protein